MSSELFFSLDIETNGKIPFIHSMIQMGLVAFTETEILDRFSMKLKPWPDSGTDEDTMNWWFETPERRAMYAELTSGDLREPDEVMLAAVGWIDSLAKQTSLKPVCVCAPVAFDMTFFRCYCIACIPGVETPFGHRAIDLRTYMMAIYGKDYLDSKRALPAEVQPLLDNSHDALEDAERQARLFQFLLKEGQHVRTQSWNYASMGS